MLALSHKYGAWGFITGATSGIGKAFSYTLASMGMNLVIVARNEENLQRLQTKLQQQYQVECHYIILDLAAPDFMSILQPKLEPYNIGLAIISAGVEMHGAFDKTSLANATFLTQLNVTAPMQLSLYFANLMRAKKQGGIIFIGSLSGHMTVPYMANYAASKAYILSLGEALYAELKADNVDVLVSSPGVVATAMTENMAANGADFSRAPKFLSAEFVVKDALKNLGKRPCTVPGKFNKVLAFISRHLPRRLAVFMWAKMTASILPKEQL